MNVNLICMRRMLDVQVHGKDSVEKPRFGSILHRESWTNVHLRNL